MSNKWELLKKEDEEFQMLREVANIVTEKLAQKEKQGVKISPQKKGQICGETTENIIREHLMKYSFNISRNRVFIDPCDVEIDLLLLKHGVDPEKKCYLPDEVDMVLEIKNNAVPSRRNKKPVQPSIIIRENFNQLEKEVKVNRFAVVVLSERLLSRTPYKYAIEKEKIKKENCRVFTLVARKKYPKGGLYLNDIVLEMLENRELWRTGEWEELNAYLKG